MDFTHVLERMLLIFGVVVTGFLAARRGLWPSGLDRPLSVFILGVTMPCLILASVADGNVGFSPAALTELLAVAAFTYVVLLGAAYGVSLLWRVGPERRGLQRFMLTFGNVSFIGYPVVDAIFGPRAVFCASVINIPFNLLIFTVGVRFVTASGGGRREPFTWRQLTTPCVTASVAALAVALLGIGIPRPAGEWLHLVGDMTTPASLLIIGSGLSRIRPRDMAGSPFVYGVAVLRLVGLPLAVASLLRLAGADPFMGRVAAVLTAMPVATNGMMFCLKYGVDERLMTQGLFLTTLLSVFTIPLVALVLC